MLKKAVTFALALVMVCVMGLSMPSRALASTNCTGENGHTACIYSLPTPYSQFSYFLQVSVYAPGFPSMVDTAINNAINNWNVSGANVRMTRVSTTHSSNLLPIYPATAMRFDTNYNCSSPWGQSWNGDPNDSYIRTVYLNQNIYGGAYGCSQSVDAWTEEVAHEMGHAMGLDHNAYDLFSSVAAPGVEIPGGPQYVMMKDGYQAKHNNDHSPITIPTGTEVGLLNSLYPYTTVLCLSYPGDYYCDGMDPVVQNCGQTYTAEHDDFYEGWIELRASGNCETNWAKASAWGGYRIYRISVERQSGSDGGALYTEDMPVSSQYYGNMIFAHYNVSRVCATFVNIATGAFSSRYCTGWH